MTPEAYQRVLDEIQAATPGPGVVECGECGFRWDDTLITSFTPAPGGRCPNEYNHDEPAMFDDIERAITGLLVKYSGTAELPFLVTLQEDGNLEIARPELTQFWAVSFLIARC